MTFEEYLSNTFAGELTNALFLAVLFGLVISDLRKFFPIEKFFRIHGIQNTLLKILLFVPYYFLIITFSLFGVIVVVSFFYLISLLTTTSSNIFIY